MKLYYDAPWEGKDDRAGFMHRSNTVKLAITAIALLFTSVIALLCYAQGESLALDSVQAVATRGLIYDSGAVDRSSQPSSEIIETRHASFKSFHLKMRVMVDSFGAHTNLFQTAPGNDGIRMECAPDGTLALIIGFPDAQGFRPFIVTSAFTPHVWHDIDVNVSAAKRVHVSFDGTVNVDAIMPGLEYAINDVVIGNGFSKTRPLAGRIDDARLRYDLYETVPVRKFLIQFVMFASAVVSVLLLYLLGSMRRRVFQGAI